MCLVVDDALASTVLDRLYGDPLNRSSLFEVERVGVEEPGRTLWVQLRLASGGDAAL